MCRGPTFRVVAFATASWVRRYRQDGDACPGQKSPARLARPTAIRFSRHGSQMASPVRLPIQMVLAGTRAPQS